MEIQGEDFKLKYEGNSNYWDLYMMKVIHKDDPDKRREELTIFGYSLTLVSAIQRIIQHRLITKQEVYTLKGYVHSYEKAVAELHSILNLEVDGLDSFWSNDLDGDS